MSFVATVMSRMIAAAVVVAAKHHNLGICERIDLCFRSLHSWK